MEVKETMFKNGLDLLSLRVGALVLDADHLLKRSDGMSDRVYAMADTGRLRDECDRIGFTDIGRACITGSHGLKCDCIVHTLSPERGDDDAEGKLASCYADCVAIARKNGCQSIAFPLLGVERHGWSAEESAAIAERVLRSAETTSGMNIIVAVP